MINGLTIQLILCANALAAMASMFIYSKEQAIAVCQVIMIVNFVVMFTPLFAAWLISPRRVVHKPEYYAEMVKKGRMKPEDVRS